MPVASSIFAFFSVRSFLLFPVLIAAGRHRAANLTNFVSLNGNRARQLWRMAPKKDTEKKGQEPEKRGKRNAGKEKAVDEKMKQDGSENGDEPVKRSRRNANAEEVNGAPSKKVVDVQEEMEAEEAPKGKPPKKPKATTSESEPAATKKPAKKPSKKEENAEKPEEDAKAERKTRKASNKTKKEEPKEEGAEEDNEEPPQAKKRGPKLARTDRSEPAEKTRKKGAKAKEAETEKVASKKTNATKAAKSEDPEAKEPMNKTGTDWGSIDFTCTKKNKHGQTFNLKISTWNVGGLKAWVKKSCHEYLEHERPDIFCIQETKSNEDNLPKEIEEIKDYKQYWCASTKNGYAGVGLFTRKEPISITKGIEDETLDEDGRCITAEYDQYYVVCVYVPNAGRKLVTLPKRLEWNEKFKRYIKELDKKKPVIICGDMNVSHKEIDLARPKTNTKNAGFTPEEREGMTEFLDEGFVDTWRSLYPDKADAYTFWTYMSNARTNNVGWRLDYFIVSERIMDDVCDNVIRSEVFGSDHCPVTLFLNI